MKNNPWTQEEKDFLKENYLKMSNKEMAVALCRTNSAIQIKLSRYGFLRPDKYSYDKDYFKEINTEEKAYWLGFIYADGYVVKTSLSAELGIELNIKDIDHLKKFNKSIAGNVEVKKRSRFDSRTNNTYNMCFIRFYSIQLVDNLINQGVFPNKHKDIKFPKIKEDLVRHFIRGYFDGDGCIRIEEKKRLIRCDFASTAKEFLDSIRDVLYDNNINTFYVLEKSGVNRLYISDMKSNEDFLNYIYGESKIYLERKYNMWNLNRERLDIINRISKRK